MTAMGGIGFIEVVHCEVLRDNVLISSPMDGAAAAGCAPQLC